MNHIAELVVLAAVASSAAVISSGMIVLLRPWLERYALVAPNPRSSHRQPTPQGAGLAVLSATLLVVWGARSSLAPSSPGEVQLIAATAGAVALAIIGAIDDLRGAPLAARLTVQCAAVAAIVLSLPEELRLVPQLPLWSER